MPYVAVCSICAFFGAIITFSFGMWTEALTMLIVVMGIDYITGITASLREGKGLSSAIGFWGLARKGLMLLVILLAHRIDLLLELDNITIGGAIYFYLTNELISIVENYGQLGLPLPDKVRDMIEKLKK